MAGAETGGELQERLERLERRVEELAGRLLGSPAGEAGGRPDGDGPPAEAVAVQEALLGALRGEDGLIVAFAGVDRREGVLRSLFSQVGRGDSLESAADPRQVAALCAAFSSEQRIAILVALFRAGATVPASALTDATGLTGGQLYHHLKELLRAGHAAQEGRSAYRITGRGVMTLLALGLVARAGTEPIHERVVRDDHAAAGAAGNAP